MGVLLAILYALLGIVLALALVPFRAWAAGAVHDGLPAGVVGGDWGLGLLGLEVGTDRRMTVRLLWLPVARFTLGARGGTEKGRRKPRTEKEDERKGERKAGARQRLRGAFAERRALGQMAGRLARALHLEVRASGRLGIGDPADTVALYGIISALGALPGVELDVELDWVDEVLELELAASGRLWIAELLAVAAILLLERPNRRALRAALGWSGT